MSEPEVKRLQNCLDCRHFIFDLGWGGTDVTPGDPVSIRCALYRWGTTITGDDANSFRAKMAMARNCPDYDVVAWEKQNG